MIIIFWELTPCGSYKNLKSYNENNVDRNSCGLTQDCPRLFLNRLNEITPKKKNGQYD
jgi:hypothetical protein